MWDIFHLVEVPGIVLSSLSSRSQIAQILGGLGTLIGVRVAWIAVNRSSKLMELQINSYEGESIERKISELKMRNNVIKDNINSSFGTIANKMFIATSGELDRNNYEITCLEDELVDLDTQRRRLLGKI